MPDPGALRVSTDGIQRWTGKHWVELFSGTDGDTTVLGDGDTLTFSSELVIADRETSGFPTTEVVDDPESADDGAVEDHQRSELCEVLLCSECDMELSAPACGPKHAYLADNPMEHRLTEPLLKEYLKMARHAEGRLCSACSTGGAEVPLATGDCKHVDVRADQVLMSMSMWDGLVHEASVAREMAAAVEDSMSSVAGYLLWHAQHRGEALSVDDAEYWEIVAKGVIAGLQSRIEGAS